MIDDVINLKKKNQHALIKKEYLQQIKNYHFEINYYNIRQKEQDRIIEFIDEITVLGMKYQNKVFELFMGNDAYSNSILNRATDLNLSILDNNEKIYQELRDVDDDQFHHFLLSLIKSFSDIYITEVISRLTR